MKSFIGIFAIILSISIVGCGGDDDDGGGGGGGMEGMFNTTSAESTSTANVGTSTTLIGSADPSAGMTAAQSFATNAMGAIGIVTPAASAQGGTALGTCTCEGTSCTFTDCGDEQGVSTINGTLNWAGGHIEGDLDYAITSTGMDYDIGVNIDLTVTDTSMEGSLSSDGDITIMAGEQTVSTKWTTNIDYDAVTLAAGQPTAGTSHVAASYTVAGMKYSSKGDVTYP